MTANETDALSKMTRVNLLIDLYQLLLTEKQQQFLQFYYQDDLSLGEIANETGISRQAVYSHINRAEQMLDIYESKLGLLAKQRQRQEQKIAFIERIEKLPMPDTSRQSLLEMIGQLDKGD